MRFKTPKDGERISWTKHVREKMKFYGLSERKLRQLLVNFKRREEGIVPGTIALMQPAGSKKHPTEIWLMFQFLGDARGKQVNKKIKVITAWRYPGVSPTREPLPIPEDIVQELVEEDKVNL